LGLKGFVVVVVVVGRYNVCLRNKHGLPAVVHTNIVCKFEEPPVMVSWTFQKIRSCVVGGGKTAAKLESGIRIRN